MRRNILLALLCVIFTAGAFATSPLAADPQAKIHPSLSDKFSNRGNNEKLNVIVSLAEDLPKGLSKAQAIAASQDRVIGAFKSENNGSGLSVLNRYMTLYGFSAQLTQGQANALAKRGDVKFIEEMPVHQKMYTESHPLTDVDLAQGLGYDGTGTVIAIIDDGIDLSHPAFSGKYLGGRDFADNDSNPNIDCTAQSHGTSVAGVALGHQVNDLPITGSSTGATGSMRGVAPGADFVFLKIQSASICGQSSLDGDIVGAIDWAVANKDTYGIDIISMSLGGGLFSSVSSCNSDSSAYFNATQNAVNVGITIIAASGNDGMCDSMSRPACLSTVVSVGAVYDEDMGNIGWCVSRNSCANTQRHSACGIFGRAAFEDAFADNVIVYSNSATFLDVVAPATCARSASPGEEATDCFGGTSSATPFTSGTAALILEAADRPMTPAELRAVLVDTGDDRNDPKNGRITPRVNAHSAVLAVAGNEPPPPQNQAPTAGFEDNCPELTCSFTDLSTDSDGTVDSWNWDFGDGNSSTAQNPNHTYTAAGTYPVSLTVTDDKGATDTLSRDITVSSQPPANVPPVASFTSNCTDLDCDFTDTSGDSDGSVVSWNWNFGDGGSSTARNPSHSYAAGTYTVTLTVTDDGGETDTATGSVTAIDPVVSDYDLEGSTSSQRNRWNATVTDNNGGTLSGTWSASGTESCSANTCTLSGIRKNVGSVTFTTSDGKANITILKP